MKAKIAKLSKILRNTRKHVSFDEKQFYKNLAGVILEFRQETGQSQAELAEHCGLSRSTIAGLENGGRRVKFLTIIRLLKSLK